MLQEFYIESYFLPESPRSTLLNIFYRCLNDKFSIRPVVVIVLTAGRHITVLPLCVGVRRVTPWALGPGTVRVPAVIQGIAHARFGEVGVGEIVAVRDLAKPRHTPEP